MAAESARQFQALERQAQGLMAVFARAGCEAVAPAIVQPADVFLDVIGEDLRARTYVFTDPDGAELCLRPDLTVPTARIYLARHPRADQPARYCYNGPAFRFQPLGASAAHPSEFRQAGIELFGDGDPEAAECEVLRLVVEGVRGAGLADFQLRIGDLGLFHALLDDLDMPERGRQRLRAQFWRPDAFRAALRRLASSPAGSLKGLPPQLVQRLDPAAREASQAAVERWLEDNGIGLIGERGVPEITASLLAALEDSRSEPIPTASAEAIERYLAIRGPAPDAARELAGVMPTAGRRSEPALAAFRRRLDLIAATGIAPADIAFSAEFGRNLEYYTGHVFEILSPRLGARSPVAGGGRYDRLLAAVGAPREVPAVGSAIHTERLLADVNGGTS